MDTQVENGDATENAEHQLDNGGGSNTGADQNAEQNHAEARRQPPRWATERISEISRQRREAEQRVQEREARIAELERKLADQAAGGEGGGGGAAPISQRAIEEMAERIADRKLTQRQHQDLVTRTESAGRKEFDDFDQVMEQFGHIGGIPAHMFQAVTRLENSHRVLYALGNDLDRAAELLKLDPVSMGIELAKLGGNVQQKPRTPLSRTPEPIETPSGRSGAEKNPDEMDQDEWFAWRESEARKRR